ncbi:MAG: hypothetical protein RL711_1933, partial [Bacteroidota bacterium]
MPSVFLRVIPIVETPLSLNDTCMKILLVEDEAKVAAFIKKGLEEQSYEVDVAFDGAMGKRLALYNLYDVIVMDVNMP